MAGELNKSGEVSKLISAPQSQKSSGSSESSTVDANKSRSAPTPQNSSDSIKVLTVDALDVKEPQQAKISETLPGFSQANTTTRSANEKAYVDTTNVMWVFATNARVAEFSNVS
jgi:hypothetical protein